MNICHAVLISVRRKQADKLEWSVIIVVVVGGLALKSESQLIAITSATYKIKIIIAIRIK